MQALFTVMAYASDTSGKSITDQPITFTIGGVWVALIGVCAGLLTIWAFLKALNEAKVFFRKHEVEQTERIERLETECNNLNTRISEEISRNTVAHEKEMAEMIQRHNEIMASYHMTRDKHEREIQVLSEGMLLQLRNSRAMLQHMLYGNHVNILEDCLNDTEEYLYAHNTLKENVK